MQLLGTTLTSIKLLSSSTRCCVMLCASKLQECAGRAGAKSVHGVRYGSTLTGKLKAITVAQLLEAKQAERVAGKAYLPLRCADRKAPILDAVRQMFGNGSAGALLITDGQTVIGSINEKDYVCSLTHGSVPPNDIVVEQIMSEDIPTATLNTPVVDLLATLLNKGRRHAPVLKADISLVSGAPLKVSDISTVVSVRDMVGMLAAEVAAAAEEEEAESVAEKPSSAPSTTTTASTHASTATTPSSTASSAAAEPKASSSGARVLSWNSKASDLLADMQARGGKILLNTRLEDNITVADAANVMADKHMSCVAVVNDDGVIMGLFTARDFLTRVVLPGYDAVSMRVKDIMTKTPHTAPLDRSVLRCARSMTKRNIRHLPIVDDKNLDKVAGLISMVDIARAFVAQFGGVENGDNAAANTAATKA